jgi:hypothetical protein
MEMIRNIARYKKHDVLDITILAIINERKILHTKKKTSFVKNASGGNGIPQHATAKCMQFFFS